MAASTIEISEARKTLNTIDERLKDERVVVVTRRNRRAFAMIDLDTLASVVKIMDTLGNPEAMRSLRDSIGNIPAAI